MKRGPRILNNFNPTRRRAERWLLAFSVIFLLLLVITLYALAYGHDPYPLLLFLGAGWILILILVVWIAGKVR